MLSEICVRRPVFATMLVMSLVVLGIFSFRDLGVDLFPRADPATVNVTLALPGASPDEISSSVIEPMEEAISGVSGIDELSARINEGGGTITVRFVLERNLNDAANDVREKVASAIKMVPPELLPPVITKVDPDSDPVMSLMVSSDAMSLRTLTEIADKQVSRSIQTVNGVGQITIAGTRAREIHIVVDIDKLNSYGLSISQVRDAVVAENVEIPGGAVEQQRAVVAAHAGPHRRQRGLQQHRDRDDERHADSGLGRRVRRGLIRAADLVGLVRRQAGGAARHPPRHGREHRGRDRRRPEPPAVDHPVAAQVGEGHDGT